MILQQLLQRNHQNVRQVFLDQKRKKNIFSDQYFQRRKPSQFKYGQQGLKLSLSNLLLNQVTQSDLMGKNKLIPQTKNQSSLKITRNRFLISDLKTQQIQSCHLNISQNNRSRPIQSGKTSRLQSAQKKLHKTDLSFYKTFNKNAPSSSVEQRKITTAGLNSPRFNSFDKCVFELPESFNLETSKSPLTPKISMTPLNRPHSTFINYDQNPGSGRQQSIHSRGRMRRQEQIMRSRKARSQQNFYVSEESITQPIKKLDFLKETKEIQFKKEQGLCLEIEKINLQQKSITRNEYVNVFYEYRKSKAKLQKQDVYTPWKKNQKDNKKSLDLTQLIQMHQY